MMATQLAYQPLVETMQPTTTMAFPDGTNKKVLVIDDSPEIRMLICESLRIYGFTALDAPDGRAGVKMAKEQLPDLVICDVNMPQLDGYGTLTALRADEATTTVPFIFLTGAADKLNMRRGMELGADDYLTKPFTHQELMAAVQTRLEKQAELQRQSEKKLDELRGSLSLALPHELRTPLNGVLGLAAIMIEDYATMPPDEVLESARYIHESALRLHRLIENFLVYSQIQLIASKSGKIEAIDGMMPLEIDVMLPSLLDSIAARFQRQADLQTDLARASLLLPEDNFKKVVEELVDNAFKFSTAGQLVRVAATVNGRLLKLVVSDCGRGMTPEQMVKIGPHMQFERSVYEQQGAGLGLVIAKRLTELLGGQFQIESVPSKGTTVRISFPLSGA